MSLTRNGHSVRLSEQTARVLAEFMAHPGELITRQQLCDVLWPDGVFTDSERGINNTISKLRLSLRDDPAKPKYIETIPKRGYKFLAPVELVEDSPEEPMVTQPAPAAEDSGVVSTSLHKALGELLDANPHPSYAPSIAGPLSPDPATGAQQTSSMRPINARRRPSLLFVGLALLALVAASVVAVRRHRGRSAMAHPARMVLAVAPFDANGVALSQQQLGDSLRLDLIDGLSSLPGIDVRAAHSVAAATTDGAGRKTPQDLNVDAILYTQISQSAGLYDLHLELVRNRDSTHLQSWRYTGSAAQLGSIREQIEADVFSYVKGTGTARRNDIGGTANPVAYEAYLRGRYHARQRDADALDDAAKAYREAIARDPDFAKAYSGLAMVTFLSAASGDSYDRAEQLARKAIDMAPNLAEGHAVLGYISFFHDWHFSDGEREIRQAIAIDSNEPNYHIWLALELAILSRFDEGLAQIDIAKQYDPYWPPVYQDEAYVASLAHDTERMTRASDRLLELNPGSSRSYDTRAWVEWHLGRYAKAIGDWHRVGEMKGNPARIALEDRGLSAFSTGGEPAYAQLHLEYALQSSKNDAFANDFVAAEWYAYAGDKEACLKELAGAVDSRAQDAVELAVNPAYAALHDDPRFRRLVQRVGLPWKD